MASIPAKVNHANLLFVYDNVIKTPDAFILKLASSKYANKLEEFMYLDMPKTTTLETLTDRLIHRAVKNPIEWLAKKEFDYDKIYNQLKEKSVRVYEDSIYLRAFDTIRIFVKSYCIGRIYIWNPSVDKRQLYDLSGLLDGSNDKVQYVAGSNLRQVIDNIGNLNVVYDWDAERIRDIVSTGVYDGILFAVGNYPFNFEPDNPKKLKYGLDEYDNVSSFTIIDDKEISYYG